MAMRDALMERGKTGAGARRGGGPWTLTGAAIAGGALIGAALRLAGIPPSGCVAIGAVSAVGLASVARPLWGYYVLLFFTILADHHQWNFFPWTHRLGYYAYENWWKLLSPEGVRNYGFVISNSVDVLLGAMGAGVLLRIARGRQRLVPPRGWVFALAYLAMIVAMFVYGIERGGYVKEALWQVRGLVHLVVIALLTPQILRTRRQLEGAVWALAIPAVFKAAQIDWIFFVRLGGKFGAWRDILGHEISSFLVAIIILGVALGFYRAPTRQRWFLLGSLPILVAGVVLNLRRASYVTLAMGLGLIPVLLHGRRRAALKLAVPALLVCVVYGAAFWNRPGTPLGLPVEKFRSVFAPEAGTVDYSSNLYRVAENINLQTTIADHPAGLGFGHKFELRVPLADISALFADWQYHPHNTLLGIWSFMGTFGVFLFLLYMGSLLIFAAQELRRQTDPYLKAVGYCILMALISGLFIATADHYLAIERGALFLGALAGMLTVLYRLRTEGPGPDRERVPAGG